MINNKGKDQYPGISLASMRKTNVPYFDFDIKKWTQKTMIRLICCCLIFLMLFALKAIGGPTTEKVIETVQYRLNQRITFADAYQQAIAFKNTIEERSNRAVAVFNLETRFTRRLILPMSGTISVFFNETIPASGKPSKGIIIEGREGQKIMAADDGVVLEIVSSPSSGYSLIIKHKGDILTVYKNMANSDAVINQRVSKGDIIGESGEKLVFEVWNKKDPVDPLEFIDVDKSSL